MRVYDLSPTLSVRTAVFPGDVAFQRNVSMSFDRGDHLVLSSISTTLHVGAHADSSSHYSANGTGVDRRDLALYVGPALVVRSDVRRGERVQFEHLSDFGRRAIEKAEADFDSIPLPARFLLWTGTFPNPENWNSDFASYDPSLIRRLAKVGVRLIGIDTPSIDPETSKRLESHAAVAQLELAVLEGLCMDQVPEGEFMLMAAPLKIENGDAGPVRALLFDGKLIDASTDPAAAPTKYEWIECEPTKPS